MTQSTRCLFICTLLPLLGDAGRTRLFPVAFCARSTTLYAGGMAALTVVFAVGRTGVVVAFMYSAVSHVDVLAVEDYAANVAAVLGVPAAMIALVSGQRVFGRVSLRALLALEHGRSEKLVGGKKEVWGRPGLPDATGREARMSGSNTRAWRWERDVAKDVVGFVAARLGDGSQRQRMQMLARRSWVGEAEMVDRPPANPPRTVTTYCLQPTTS